jgi:hypothetical protein
MYCLWIEVCGSGWLLTLHIALHRNASSHIITTTIATTTTATTHTIIRHPIPTPFITLHPQHHMPLHLLQNPHRRAEKYIPF